MFRPLHQNGSHYEVRFTTCNTFRYYVTIETWPSTPTHSSINGEQRKCTLQPGRCIPLDSKSLFQVENLLLSPESDLKTGSKRRTKWSVCIII